MTLLEQALEYAKLGYRVFPVNGKRPAIKRFNLTHATEYQIRRWWTKHPNRNIGIAPGADLVVFDPDNQEGLEFLARVMDLTPDDLLQSTRSVRTPGGGYHIYYSTSVVYKNHTAKKILDEQGKPLAIDIKTWGGFVVAPGSTSSKGTYKFISEVVPVPLPLALANLLRATGLVKYGPDTVKITYPLPRPMGWDEDEEAEGGKTGYRGTEEDRPGYCPDNERVEDIARQMTIMLPINRVKHLNRDTQQGVLVARLVRLYRRQDKAFIRQIACRWLFDQQDRFEEELPQAYAQLDRNIERAWVAQKPDGSLMFDGPDEQTFIDWMTQQLLPETTQRAKAGYRGTKQTQALLTALLKIAFWKLLYTEDDAIQFTNKQLAAVAGMSDRQVRRLKCQFLSWPEVKIGKKTRAANTATVCPVMVEVEMGHHDKQGKAHAGRFLLDDAFVALAFPFLEEDDGEREEFDQWLETDILASVPTALTGRPGDMTSSQNGPTAVPTAGGATKGQGRPASRSPETRPQRITPKPS